MIPNEADINYAYDVLHRHSALHLNSSLDDLWSDRPRLISVPQSQEATRRISETLSEYEFLRTDDFSLPEHVRVYAIHDTVLNCFCARRPKDETDIVMFSGVLAVPLMRFAVQIMLSRLDLESKPFTTSRFGDWATLVECALGYTIWQLIEKIPVTMSDLANMLSDDDQERLFSAFAGISTFLLLHEVGHIRLDHLNIQSEILMLGNDERSRVAYQHEFDADEYAVNHIKPNYRGFIIVYSRILFEIIADLETLGFQFGSSHPKAVQRLARLYRIFSDDISNSIKGILVNFLANRQTLAERLAGAQRPATGYKPIGGGATRRTAFSKNDRIIDLPAKDICHDALAEITLMYQNR